MILQLTRSINPMNESLSKTWTETDMPLQTATNGYMSNKCGSRLFRNLVKF